MDIYTPEPVKRLYDDKWENYTTYASILSEQVRVFVEPLLQQVVADGYSLRDAVGIICAEVEMVGSGCVIERNMGIRTQERG